MADWKDAFSDNVSGSWFVDSECIGCDTCVGLAPDHFKLTASNSHAFVHKQPLDNDSVNRCEQAEKDCPVNAIGIKTC